MTFCDDFVHSELTIENPDNSPHEEDDQNGFADFVWEVSISDGDVESERYNNNNAINNLPGKRERVFDDMNKSDMDWKCLMVVSY